MTVAINRNDAQPTDRQWRALSALVRQLTDRDVYVGTDPANEIAWSFDLKATTYGIVWVSVTADVPSLAPGNALRVLTVIGNSWHVEIGKRGKLTAFTYPKSLDQFAGERWCGIWIDGAQAAAREIGRAL